MSKFYLDFDLIFRTALGERIVIERVNWVSAKSTIDHICRQYPVVRIVAKQGLLGKLVIFDKWTKEGEDD